jgi:transposase, IS5 family
MHTVRRKAANVNDVVEAKSLLQGNASDVFGDAGYRGAHKRAYAPPNVSWYVAMRPSKHAALDKGKLLGTMINGVERIKVSIRDKVQHLFRAIKRQFGFVKVRYRGLKNNSAKLMT